MTSTAAFSLARQTLGYVRTLDHLRAWPLRLPRGVKEVLVAVGSGDDRQHTGTKLFGRQNVPQLKFFNPSVKFSVESKGVDHSEIIFLSDDGSRKVVETTSLHWKDIQKELNSTFTPTPPTSHSS